MVRDIAVTTTPTAVTGLTAGTTYILQNQGGQAIYVDTSASAPASSAAPGIMVPPMGRLAYRDVTLTLHGVEPTATESVYLWTRSGTSKAALAEAL